MFRFTAWILAFVALPLLAACGNDDDEAAVGNRPPPAVVAHIQVRGMVGGAGVT